MTIKIKGGLNQSGSGEYEERLLWNSFPLRGNLWEIFEKSLKNNWEMVEKTLRISLKNLSEVSEKSLINKSKTRKYCFCFCLRRQIDPAK